MQQEAVTMAPVQQQEGSNDAGFVTPFGYNIDPQLPGDSNARILSNADESLLSDFWAMPGNVAPAVDGLYMLAGYAVDGQPQGQLDQAWLERAHDYAAGDEANGVTGGAESFAGGVYPQLSSSTYHDMYSYNLDNSNKMPSQQPQSDGQAADALMSMSHPKQQIVQATNGGSQANWVPLTATAQNGVGLSRAQTVPSTSQSVPMLPTPDNSQQQSRHAPTHAVHTQQFMQAPTKGPHNMPPPAERPATQADMRRLYMQAQQQMQEQQARQQTQQQRVSYPHSPSQAAAMVAPAVQFGTDNNFAHNGYSHASHMQGRVLSPANMSSSLQPNKHVMSSQQMHYYPNKLQDLSNAALAALNTNGRTPVNAIQHTYSNDWQQPMQPMNMNHNQQPSRKRTYSETGGEQSARPAPAMRRGNTAPKSEARREKNALMTPPTSTKRRRSSEVGQDSNSSSTGSPPTPAAITQTPAGTRRRGGANQGRSNLTEQQKRDNHIASEQKRRNAMNKNFGDLNEIVPSLQKGQHGLSREHILYHAADYLEYAQKITKILRASPMFKVGPNGNFSDLDDADGGAALMANLHGDASLG